MSYGIGFFGIALVTGWVPKYSKTYFANFAFREQNDKTLTRFLIIYTIIPACFVVLQIVPILFYDLNKKKKEEISEALIERRGIIEE